MTRSALARALASRIDRLREAFAALDAAVREKVAEIAGKAVADAVRGAVRAALESVAPPPASDEDPDYDPWADDPDDRKPSYRTHWTSTPAPPKVVDRLPRVAAAVLAGCRTAGWWLARRSDRPGWGWVAAGVAAAALAYASGPLAAAVLPAAAAVALAARAAGLATVFSNAD